MKKTRLKRPDHFLTKQLAQEIVTQSFRDADFLATCLCVHCAVRRAERGMTRVFDGTEDRDQWFIETCSSILGTF